MIRRNPSLINRVYHGDEMKAFAILSLLALGSSVLAQEERRRRGAARGPDKAPALGAAIPKVSAKSADGKRTVELSKPARHTVLIFGSHT